MERLSADSDRRWLSSKGQNMTPRTRAWARAASSGGEAVSRMVVIGVPWRWWAYIAACPGSSILPLSISNSLPRARKTSNNAQLTGGLEFVVGRSAGPPVESELAQIYERGGNVPLERQHQGEPTDRRLADDTSPGDQHRAAGSRCECRRDFVRSGGRERRPLSHRASIRSGVNKGGQPPTCTRGRLSGSGTARRSISWVRGGTSPSPANKNRSAFCPGALSDHSK